MEEQELKIQELARANESLKFRANRYKMDFKSMVKKYDVLETEIVGLKQLVGAGKNIKLMARVSMLEDNINKYRLTLDDTRKYDSIINDGNIKQYILKIQDNENAKL